MHGHEMLMAIPLKRTAHRRWTVKTNVSPGQSISVLLTISHIIYDVTRFFNAAQLVINHVNTMKYVDSRQVVLAIFQRPLLSLIDT